MKQKFYTSKLSSLTVLLIFVFTLIILIFSNYNTGTVYGIQECDNAYPGANNPRNPNADSQKTKLNACNAAFTKSKANPNLTVASICVDQNINDLKGDALEGCKKGIEFAGTVSNDTVIEREATQKCISAFKVTGNQDGNRDEREACKSAYIAKKKNPDASKNEICKDKKGDAKTGCEGGFELADKGFTPDQQPTLDEAAQQYCNALYPASLSAQAKVESEKRKPCRTGYKAGFNQKTKAEACKDLSGDSKAACEKGFDRGKQAKIDGFVKDNEPDSDGEPLADCDIKWHNPLSWIICPIIDIGAGLSDTLFQDVIKPLLSDVPVSTNTKDPIYIVWQGFRLIANLLLVGSLLIVVYAQTRGGDK